MVIMTPWGQQQVVAARAVDGRWYAVLRDPPPTGVIVGGVAAATLEASVMALSLQCRDAVRGRSA